MAESISKRLARLETLDSIALRKLLDAALADLATLQADVAAMKTAYEGDLSALDTALDAMATKLNSDAGVTDTDYAGAGSAMDTVTLTSSTTNLTS